MKDACIINKRGKAKFGMLLGWLFLIVLIGLCPSVRAAAANMANETNQQSFSRISYFDPFNLTTIYIESSSSKMVVLRGPQRQPTAPGSAATLVMTTLEPATTLLDVRIPFRPVLRSPFRPPLVLR